MPAKAKVDMSETETKWWNGVVGSWGLQTDLKF